MGGHAAEPSNLFSHTGATAARPAPAFQRLAGFGAPQSPGPCGCSCRADVGHSKWRPHCPSAPWESGSSGRFREVGGRGTPLLGERLLKE
jgi:hypothetical protein